MTKEYSPDRLDIKAFAQAGGHLSGHDSLLKYERLAQEAKGLHPDLLVDWKAVSEIRPEAGGPGQIWLHLSVHASFPMECQRCLTPVDVPLDVERSFRFVADEATAEALDEECDEDLLALSREFDLRELIEDELLLACPMIPLHAARDCAGAAAGEAEPAPEEQRHKPFAALAEMMNTNRDDH